MSTEAIIRVLSVDDHQLVREGLSAVMNLQPDMQLVAQACSGREAVAMFRIYEPDITLMDVSLPDMTGVDALIAIRAEYKNARVIMLSTFEGDVQVREALKAGAQGYMVKSASPKELMNVIRRVHAGKKAITPEVAASLAEYMGHEPLTARETEVLRHLAGGNRNRDIADILNISEDTVKAHVKRLMEKLDASDRTQAVAIGVRRGFIKL